MPSSMSVIISYAQSLDGRVATASGASRWISCPESLEYAHSLRRDNDAILVGIGTVLSDDPLLTCRLPNARSPQRIVLDSALRIPRESQIVRTASEVPTTVLFNRDCPSVDTKSVESLRSLGLEVAPISHNGKGLVLCAVLEQLSARGVRSVFVEGGPGVITAFLREDLVDELHLVVAPIMIGTGVAAVGELGVTRLEQAPRFETVSVSRLGEDLLWLLRKRNVGR